jgi:folate-binding Fe-S cluster repair protein YgfZ
MLNLDLTGGISFKKGCYPGQEIVARTQYLGKVKRRMLRFSVDGVAASVAAGTSVFAAADADQALGQVVLAAPGDAGSQQLLAVLQMDLAAGADLRLAEASGPALRPLPLPYPLD